jgi:sulfur relay (sulfurtransferase) DsrC/TusE family protein
MVNAHYVIIDFRAKFFVKIQYQASDTSRSLPRSIASDLGKSKQRDVLVLNHLGIRSIV